MFFEKYNIQLSSKKSCTGCMACVDSCAVNAIHASIGDDGFYHIITNKFLCKKCGRCIRTCPVTKVNKNNHSRIKPKPFAAWSKDDEVRLLSASGGAFAELALQILSEGGRVIGATLRDNKVLHIMIDEKKDLCLLQNSKYIQSNLTGIYRLAEKSLKDGNLLLFSGTPCQIAGLYGFLDPNIYSELLVTVEVICHGVPSEILLNEHLKINQAEKIINFRNKNRSHSDSYKTLLMKRNKIFSPKNIMGHDSFYTSFFSDSALRNSCYNCKYSILPRVADISLGDYWGSEECFDEKEKGISLVLVNSVKGSDLLHKLNNLTYYETEWEKCLLKNPRIYSGYSLKQYLPSRLLFNLLINNIEKKPARKILNLLPSKKNSWLFIFKITEIVISFLQKQKMMHKYHIQINLLKKLS